MWKMVQVYYTFESHVIYNKHLVEATKSANGRGEERRVVLKGLNKRDDDVLKERARIRLCVVCVFMVLIIGI